jgi:hypothetical protein
VAILADVTLLRRWLEQAGAARTRRDEQDRALTPALRRDVAIVAVSVDPTGDTADTVAALAWNVGSEKDVSRPELVNHSALVYGVSASGKLMTIHAEHSPHDKPLTTRRCSWQADRSATG